MTISRSSTLAAAAFPAMALLAMALLPSAADAQFGYVDLPRDDFTWNWGDRERAGRVRDFSVEGTQRGFRCNLAGDFRAGSRVSSNQIRQMEVELASTLRFIELAAARMNALQNGRELDWATLDCEKFEPEESTDAEREAREEEARRKAVERMLERREREQRRGE